VVGWLVGDDNEQGERKWVCVCVSGLCCWLAFSVCNERIISGVLCDGWASSAT
jgi:hypothetical protein